ncbi:hypothetical protein HA402_011358 [Bradysia odoriphaga]|nr:hypothetical protein HA402_011358 [Bradysia odoriphaga]
MIASSSAFTSKQLTSALQPNFDPSKIKKKNVNLKPISADGKLAFLLYNVFSRDECEALIKLSEECGYGEALVNIGGGREMRIKGFRDSSRVLIDDKAFVERLFQRISLYLPSEFMNETVVAINERLRFLRYQPGDKFKPHFDGSYCRPDNSAETLITIQIYLNENFVGGETNFLDRDDETKCVPVKPVTGMVLVFEHRIFHEGSVVRKGKKYAIRTDVLYTRENVRKFVNVLRNRTEDNDDDGRKVRCVCQ